MTPLKISEQGFEDAYFIVCKTKKGAEFLSENYGDWQNPWEDEEPDSGVWVFCDDTWISAKDVFELAEKIGKAMNKSEMALKPLSLEGYL